MKNRNGRYPQIAQMTQIREPAPDQFWFSSVKSVQSADTFLAFFALFAIRPHPPKYAGSFPGFHLMLQPIDGF